jgi:large subunit ribosomal protein L25
MELTVSKRERNSNAKSLRSKGVLPAVVYGRSEESTPIAVDQKEFEKVFKAAGESTMITLKGLGAHKDVLIHEVDVDPVSSEPLHADFYAIEKGQKVTVSIPLEFVGESVAVKEKEGILVKVMHELEIEVEPKELPRSIEVDISKLVELEDQIKVSDLPLPPSAKFFVDVDEVVAMVDVVKEEVEEEAPGDISQIEISEERGKKEEEAEAAEGAEEKKE